MQVFREADLEWEASDPAHLTGQVRLKRLIASTGDPEVKTFRVEFAPQSRTFWHAHSGPQLLLVVEGRCRVQKWGEEIQEVGVGDTVAIEPGEKHWHGAAPGSTMTHVAFNVNTKTTWMEEVTEEQYSGKG